MVVGFSPDPANSFPSATPEPTHNPREGGSGTPQGNIVTNSHKKYIRTRREEKGAILCKNIYA